MASYYDYILGLIPLAMGGVSAALAIAGFSLTTAIVAGSLIAIGLIGHGMFFRTPMDSSAEPAPHTSTRPTDGRDIGPN